MQVFRKRSQDSAKAGDWTGGVMCPLPFVVDLFDYEGVVIPEPEKVVAGTAATYANPNAFDSIDVRQQSHNFTSEIAWRNVQLATGTIDDEIGQFEA